MSILVKEAVISTGPWGTAGKGSLQRHLTLFIFLLMQNIDGGK